MFEQAFKNIDDVLRKEAGCTTELDYTEQSSWLLFLKYLDDLEQDKATEAALEGKKYAYILDKPFRWESWAAPKGKDGKLDHNKALTGDDLRDFVNGNACGAALISLVLLAVIRGDLFAEQMKNTAPVFIFDDAQPQPQAQTNFYDATVVLLRFVMALLAVAMELGAGLALHEA